MDQKAITMPPGGTLELANGLSGTAAYGDLEPAEDEIKGKITSLKRQDGKSRAAAVVIRNMNHDDSDFCAKMATESFRSKFEKAIGAKSIDGFIRATASEYRRTQEKYGRTFIALYQGKLAGLVQIKFQGDNYEDQAPYCSEIGCWSTLRLSCMGCIIDESVASHNECYIDHICVDEHYRGRGIGQSLLERADEEARTHGCKRIYLWVAATNRAKSLYERHGYNVVEREDGLCITSCTVGFRHWLKMAKELDP